MRAGLLFFLGLLALLARFLLPDPGRIRHLDLRLERASVSVGVDGRHRADLDLAPFAGGTWRLAQEAQGGAALRARMGAIPGTVALPLRLSAPARLELDWAGTHPAVLTLIPWKGNGGCRLGVDAGRNELSLAVEAPGQCGPGSYRVLPLDDPGLGLALARLARTLAAALAGACLGLATLLGLSEWAPPRCLSVAVRLPSPRHLALAAAPGATLAAAWMALVPLGRLPKSFDDVGLLFQARIEAQGVLAAPLPPLPRFFAVEGLDRMGQGWTGKQAPAWPWILGQALKLRLAWAVNPLLAGLGAWLLADLALAAGLGWEAVAGAWTLALSPFYMETGGSYLNMTPELAAFLAFCGALWGLGRAPRPGPSAWMKALGFLAVLALLRAYSAVWACLGACAWLAGEGAAQRKRALALGVLGLSLVLALVFLQNHLQTGNGFLSSYQAYNPRDHPGFGSGVGIFPTWGTWGHSPAKAILNINLYLGLLARRLDGLPAGLALLPILAGILGRRADALDRLLWWLAGALVLGYAFYFSADTIHGPRYWFEAGALLVLLQVRGLATLMARLDDRGPAGMRWPALALLVMMVAGGVALVLPGRSTELLSDHHVEGRLRAAVTLLPAKPSLVFFDSADPSRYVEPFGMQDPWLRAPYVFARDQGSAAADAPLAALFPDRRVLYWDGSVLSPRRWTGCALPL